MKNIVAEWLKNKQRTDLAAAITNSQQPKIKSALMMQLEPRIMFDGAAVATAVDIAHHDVAEAKDVAVAEKPPVDAKPVTTNNSAPVETSPVDTSAGLADTRHEIIFVDTSVQNYQSLLGDINPNIEVVLIHPQQDGLKVIADTLADRHDVDAIHIISHGEEGKIQLGADSIDSHYLASHADLLATIGNAMSENGDILLYGCKVGADGTGLDFVQSLAQATHADVAASTDNTGSAQLGGNWVLETHTGNIEAKLFGNDAVLSHYDALLAAPTSENFDGVTVDGTGRSQGTTGAARIIDGWTFQLLNAAGTLDSGSYVDITHLTGDTSLADNGSDKAAYLNGTYAGGTGTQAAGVFKATTGEEFKFVSITVENGGGADTYRLVGYRDGSAVSGATQNFTAPAYGSNTVVSVSGSQWDYVDEVRLVQQNGAADISIYVDDIVVTTAVPPNIAPVATTSGGTTAFTEGNNVTSTPVVVDSSITITDSDNSTLASGTVSITGGFQNGQDVLAFTNNPATMGNISGTYTAGTGILSLSSAGATATLAQWQAAMRSVTYTNSSDSPNTSNRTLSFVVNDGTSNSTAGTKTVSVTSVNDTPIATASGGTTAFTEGNNVTSTPVVIDSSITVTDLDSTTLSTATVSITGNLQTSEDVLAFTNNPATMGNISGSYTAGTGILSLSSAGATATLAQWQAALRSVTYTNSSDSPNTSNRTISFAVNDGSTTSTTTTKTVSVVSTNDTPVSTTSGGNTAFTEGNNTTSTPVAVDSAFTVTDGDNSTLASATVAITGNLHTSEDSLAFTNNPATMGNITGSYTAGTGVLNLSSAGATATLAQWQAALRSITYSNSSETPNTSNRTISFTTNDGTADGNTSTKIVTVASVNDSPITTASGGTTAFTEGANVTSTPVVIDSGITVSDVDNTTLSSATVSITSNLHTAEDVLAFTNNPATMGNISGSYTAGTGILSLSSAGSTATLAQWQSALRSVTYTNSSDAPNTANRTISFVVNDGNSNSTATTKTVSVASVNDTPVDTTTGGNSAFVQGNNVVSTPVMIDSGFTVTDGDNSTLASATVAITGNFQNGEDELAFINNPATMGNISASYNAATGVLTLTSAGATATTAQWQSALRSVTYTDTASTVNTSNRTISFTTNDGTADGNTATKVVTVTATAQSPVGSTSGGTTAFTEGANVTSTPVVVDSGFTVSDADNSTLSSATVSITGNFQASEDVLAFTNNPAIMGNITGSYAAGTGILTLSSAGNTATLAQWQAALQSVTYTNSSDAPNTSNRTISFVLNDGSSNSTAANKTVSIAAVNDVPVDTTTGGTTAFSQGNPISTPVVIDSGFTVTDGDNSTLSTATVAITGNFQNGEDELGFTNNPATMGNISASYNAVTGVLTLTSAGATATTAQWQSALRSVTYTDTAGMVNTSTRTISFTTNDGTADGNTATKSVSVTAYNFPPVTTTSGGSAAFTEGANVTSTPVVIDSGITVSDIDTANLASATVSITGNFQNGEDVLVFTNNPATMGNISASYNAGTGVLTLTSAGDTATVAQWQAALQSITYTNSSDAPNTGNRTVSFAVNDGNSTGNVATRDITIAAVNDVPVDTTTGGTTAFNQDTPTSTPVVIDSGFTVTDGDNTTLASATVAITGNFQNGEDELAFTNNPATMGNISASYNAATGVLTLTSAGATATTAQWQNALRSITYTDTAGMVNTSTRTISFTTNDGTADGNTATKSVSVTAFNFPPVTTSSGGTTTFTEGAVTSTPVIIDAGITVSDVDSSSLDSATVSITGNFQSGEDVLAFVNNPATMGNISASYDASTGVLTLTSADATATVAQWQAALRSVTYTDNSHNPDTGNRTISFAVNDGNSTGNTATKVIAISAFNNDPVNNVPTAQTIIENGNLTFNIGNGNLISVSDVDAGGGVQRVTLTASNGLLTLSGTSGLSFLVGSGSNDGTMTFEGTLTDINNALNGLGFTPTPGYHGPASIQLVTNDLGLSGSGGNKTDTDTININVVGINPAVLNINSPASNGTYVAGQVIDVSVKFDQTVNVDTTGGSPTLLLETGSTDRTAIYLSGSGTDTLTFRYTVQAGDSSADLDAQSTSALALNGATIQSVANNNAVLTLPALGGADSLAGQKALVVNGISLTVNSVSVPASNTYTEGQNLDFTVNMSSIVNVTGSPRIAITLDTGGTIYANYVSGSGSSALTFRAIVAAGQQDNNGIVVGSSIDLNGGSIVDSWSNNANPTLHDVGATTGVQVDAIPPIIANINVPAAGYYHSGDVLSFTLNTSETVIVNSTGGTPQLSLNIGGSTVLADYVSGSGSTALVFHYTLKAGDNDLDGITIGALSSNGATLKDAAGNNLNVALQNVGATNRLLVDTTAPLINAITPADANPTHANTLTYLATFSEDVTGVDAADFNLATNGTATGNIAGLTRIDAHTYSITVNNVSGSGTLGLNLNATGTGIKDLAGNAITGGLTGAAYTLDKDAPRITDLGIPGNGTYIAGQQLNFSVTLSEAVVVDTSGGTPRIVITLDTGGTLYANYVSGSGSKSLNFSATVASGQLDTDGISISSAIDANGGAVQDLVGNNANLTFANIPATTDVRVDAIAPRANIQLVEPSTSSAQTVDFTVSFDEPVKSVDIGDFSLTTTGSVTAAIGNITQTNDHTWTITVNNISGDGTLRLDIQNATDISDIAGNRLNGASGATFTAVMQPPVIPLPPVVPPVISLPPMAPVTPVEISIQPTPSAPLIVLTADASAIGGVTNSSPLTTVEAPPLITLVSPVNAPTVSGIPVLTNTTNLDTSSLGGDPIGVATATSTGTIANATGALHLATATATINSPTNSPTIDRLNTTQDTGLQGSPLVGSVDVSPGVPLYIPLPGTVHSNDANQQFSVDVRLLDGKPLMSWLHFDPVTGTLTGQAPKGFEGKVKIQVIVRDSKGNSVTSLVELNFSEHNNQREPVKTAPVKPGAQLMGKPALHEQFARYSKHSTESDALLSALKQLSLVPANRKA